MASAFDFDDREFMEALETMRKEDELCESPVTPGVRQFFSITDKDSVARIAFGHSHPTDDQMVVFLRALATYFNSLVDKNEKVVVIYDLSLLSKARYSDMLRFMSHFKSFVAAYRPTIEFVTHGTAMVVPSFVLRKLAQLMVSMFKPKGPVEFAETLSRAESWATLLVAKMSRTVEYDVVVPDEGVVTTSDGWVFVDV